MQIMYDSFTVRSFGPRVKKVTTSVAISTTSKDAGLATANHLKPGKKDFGVITIL